MEGLLVGLPGGVGPPAGLGEFLFRGEVRETRFDPPQGVDVGSGGCGGVISGRTGRGAAGGARQSGLQSKRAPGAVPPRRRGCQLLGAGGRSGRRVGEVGGFHDMSSKVCD